MPTPETIPSPTTTARVGDVFATVLRVIQSEEAEQRVKAKALSAQAQAEHDDDSSWDFIRDSLSRQAAESWQLVEKFANAAMMLEGAISHAKIAGVL